MAFASDHEYDEQPCRAARTPRLEHESISDLRYIHKDSKLSSSEVDRLRRARTEAFLREKKLVLVLDLDNTLLHTVKAVDLSLRDLCLFALENAEDDPNKSTFIWGGKATKLRPFVRTFLREASQMFDMYIYTNGTREYALRMAGFLDPQGVYFDSKVISREDSALGMNKSLATLLADERIAVVLDDRRSVWPWHRHRVFRIKRFFFHGSSEWDGALAAALRALGHVHRLFFNAGAGKMHVHDDLSRVFRSSEFKDTFSLLMKSL